ncbi:hypothetical protein BH20ACT19_BH20ACT19_02910 [soil metagenome]
MMVRTQISLDSEDHRRAKSRAAERGISLAEYLRQVLRRDLAALESEPTGDISEIFGIISSGGSDVSENKDKYLGVAVEAEYLRETGQTRE